MTNKKRIGKNRDFWGLILRPVSKPITSFLIRFTNITPNQVTFLSLLVGIAASIFIFIGGKNLITGGILIFLFILLDNVDGEIARLKGMTSRFGHWLDFVVGIIVDELLIVAMALGIGTQLSIKLGLLAMIIFPMQFSLIYFYKAEVVKSNKPIELKSAGRLNKLILLYGSTLFQLMTILGCLFNKTMWVLVFFAVFGNLFWMGTIFLQFLNLRK